MILLVLFPQQVWRLQPHVQKEVNTALAQLRSYPGPTIAFHGEACLHIALVMTTILLVFGVDVISYEIKHFPCAVRGGDKAKEDQALVRLCLHPVHISRLVKVLCCLSLNLCSMHLLS